MTDQIKITRRRLVGASGAVGYCLGMVMRTGSVLSDEEVYAWAPGKVTPSVDSGPFYPMLNKPVDPNTDLTSMGDRKESARGQFLYVMGQVFDIKRKPVKDIQIEIWQANSAGRYNHPSDGNPAPLDPNFKGYGIAITDVEGRYRFKTVIPGGYPVIPGWWRPPHIHFQVTGRRDRLISQMWFPDDPLNSQDRFLNFYPPAAREVLTCKIEPPTGGMEPDAKIARHYFILANG
jgi:protocatechuate 3,4-dioxygenase beta subunit